ncbi:MAG: MarR family winged helix-turn-helix transcriptional regulator [Eubacteriales bacterium]|nr:MarR family winged helix-turn-helix transcriptional regulator [Eubacteriales bacterium]
MEKVSECYCCNLKKSAGWISDYYDKAVMESGLTMSQYYLLRKLAKLENANITVWAKEADLERTTMVRNVKVLEKHNFIELTEGSGKTYCLSDYGREALEIAIPIWEKKQQEMEEFLGTDDIEALLRIASKLNHLKEKAE